MAQRTTRAGAKSKRQQQKQSLESQPSLQGWLGDADAMRTPVRSRRAATFRAPAGEEDAGAMPPPSLGWDPSLLQACAQNTSLIMSVEGLQTSPLYQRSMRGKRLGHETSVDHKLRIFKALRKADPKGFTELFDRQDIKEYESSSPGRLRLAVEYLITAATTWLLLGLPLWFPSHAAHAGLRAAAWLLLQLWAWSGGFGSPAGRALGVYQTAGDYQLVAGFWRLACAGVIEAAFLIATAGLGALPSLGFRLLTQQRQSVVERLLGLTPEVEEVKPMPFHPLG